MTLRWWILKLCWGKILKSKLALKQQQDYLKWRQMAWRCVEYWCECRLFLKVQNVDIWNWYLRDMLQVNLFLTCRSICFQCMSICSSYSILFWFPTLLFDCRNPHGYNFFPWLLKMHWYALFINLKRNIFPGEATGFPQWKWEVVSWKTCFWI